MPDTIKFFLIPIAIAGAYFLFTEPSGCAAYASQYPCTYVRNRATYDVFYWKNVIADNPRDERIIGTVTGLNACKNMAKRYALGIGEDWSDRSYICGLVKDGGITEKHRLID